MMHFIWRNVLIYGKHSGPTRTEKVLFCLFAAAVYGMVLWLEPL